VLFFVGYSGRLCGCGGVLQRDVAAPRTWRGGFFRSFWPTVLVILLAYRELC
jgi:hypothetical protein